MKRAFLCFSLLAFIFSQSHAQEHSVSKVPLVTILTSEGTSINTSSFTNNDKPIILDFFATWCKPCVMELDAIADKYDYEQKRTGVKIILISVDSALPSSGKVIKFVRSKGWRYEVYLDPKGDLQKAMNVMDTPATYIIDGKGIVVWNHNSYAEGDENKLFEALDKIADIK